MIKVLHYDYTLNRDKVKRPYTNNLAFDSFVFHLVELKGVSCHFFHPVRSFLEDKEALEALLPEQDVLLIHPGVEGQKTVGEEWSGMFPNLKIALLSYCVTDYFFLSQEFTMFDYSKKGDITDFIFSAKE